MFRMCPRLIFAMLWVILCSSCVPNVPNLKGRIAFVSDQNGNSDIFVMDPNGQDRKQLTDNLSEDVFPTWSPDGQKIAFTSDRDGEWGIYTMNTDGTNQIKLKNNSPNLLRGSRLAWSP